MPDFSLTEAERAELAAQLRANTLVATLLSPDMSADLEHATTEGRVCERAIPTRVGPSRVFEVRPPEGTEGLLPLFVNIHGGGFVRGYQPRDTMFCAFLASRLGCVVLDIDYRLAPEHPFPAALHECHDVLEWAFENAESLGVDPARIAIGGHSAGGNLTAAICLMAAEHGSFRPCAQLMSYPFLDAVTPPQDKLEPHSIFPAERLQAFNVLYAGVPEALSNPLLSPVLADPLLLAKLPPALIITAGLDPLRFEAHRYGAMLAAAGCPLRQVDFAGADHGFLIAGHSAWREGRETVVGWLEEAFAH